MLIYMSYGRNYLFGENAITKCGGSPIVYQGFGCSEHQHQSRSMQFTVWDDVTCYMIENCRRARQATAGLGQLNLFSSTLGWSERGSKWYKLSIGWYRFGYRWVLPIFLPKTCKSKVQACTSGVKGTPKGTQKRK